MTKRIISAAAALCMVLGSASLLPHGTFADEISITSTAEHTWELADLDLDTRRRGCDRKKCR